MQELVKGSDFCLGVLRVLGILGELVFHIAKFLHAVQQLLDVLNSVWVVGVVVVAQQGDNARVVYNLFCQVVGVHGCQQGGEPLYHHHKVGDALHCAAVQPQPERGDILQHRPHRHIVVGCRHPHTVQCRLSDTSGRVVDDTHQRLLVVVVHHQPQVCQHVLDFLTSVERYALVYAVGDIGTPQRLLYSTRLHIGAIKYGKRLIFQTFVCPCMLYRFCHLSSFVALVGVTQQPQAVAHRVVGPHLFLYLLHILLDDRVGRVHNHLGRTVVLLQFVEVQVGVVAAEVEDILYIRSAEGVDALRIVAHHADVLVACRQFLHDEVLRVVGVLVLVHHDVFETVLILQQHIWKVPQQHVHVKQQVVEVHRHGVAQAVVILLVYLPNHRAVRVLVGLLYLGVVHVVLGTEQVALRHRYAAQHHAGTVGLGVEVLALHYLLDGRLAVVVVVDGKGVDIAQFLRLRPQYACKHRVERPHPYIACFAAHQFHDTFLHLCRRLVGKGQRQNAERVYA